MPEPSPVLPAPTGPPLLRITESCPSGTGAVLHVTGELDALTAPDLCAAVDARMQCPSEVLVIDLSGLDFLGVAGISVLDDAARAAERAGVALRLVTGPRCVTRALWAAGLTARFTSAPTLADALTRP